MATTVEYIIKAKESVSKVVRKVKTSFKSMGTSAKSAGKTVNTQFKKMGEALKKFKAGGSIAMGAIVAGMGALAIAAKALQITLTQAFKFERYETQFKVLFKSTARAKKQLRDLQEFSAKTPFQIDDIVEASRQLEVFTKGALNTEEGLKLVGDAAAVTSKPMQEISFWVGRAYAAIGARQALGEAGTRLTELALVSKDTRDEMEAMREAGASSAEIFALMEEEIKSLSKNGMEELAKTGEGLASTLRDNVNLALADFGEALAGEAKGGLQDMIDKVKELRKSGDIQLWAEDTKDGIDKVRKSTGFLAGVLKRTGRLLKLMSGPVGIAKQLQSDVENDPRVRQARKDAFSDEQAEKNAKEDFEAIGDAQLTAHDRFLKDKEAKDKKSLAEAKATAIKSVEEAIKAQDVEWEALATKQLARIEKREDADKKAHEDKLKDAEELAALSMRLAMGEQGIVDRNKAKADKAKEKARDAEIAHHRKTLANVKAEGSLRAKLLGAQAKDLQQRADQAKKKFDVQRDELRNPKKRKDREKAEKDEARLRKKENKDLAGARAQRQRLRERRGIGRQLSGRQKELLKMDQTARSAKGLQDGAKNAEDAQKTAIQETAKNTAMIADKLKESLDMG